MGRRSGREGRLKRKTKEDGRGQKVKIQYKRRRH